MLAQSGLTINVYLFAGQQQDKASGLSYMRARYYDPSLGRFTAADPLRASANDSGLFQFYAYANDDPADRSDPSGEFSTGEVTVSLAILNGLLSGASAYFRGGRSVSAGIKGFFFGFVSGLIAGGVFAEFGQLAALAGPGVAAVFNIAVPVGLTLISGVTATKALVNAQTADQKIAGGIDFLSTLIFGYFGVRSIANARTAGTGGDTPQQNLELDTEAEITGEPIKKTSPGDLADANYEIGPDPVTGKKLIVFNGQEYPSSFDEAQDINPYLTDEVASLKPDDTVVFRDEIADDAVGVTPGDLDPGGLRSYLKIKYFDHVKELVFITIYKGETYVTFQK